MLKSAISSFDDWMDADPKIPEDLFVLDADYCSVLENVSVSLPTYIVLFPSIYNMRNQVPDWVIVPANRPGGLSMSMR